MDKSITLGELMGRIKKGVESELSHMEWVVGEISQVQENASGHCYIELVEYRESDKAVVAKARAVIWDSEYRMIKPFFYSLTGSSIKAGMNVLVKVKVTYSVIYGLTLVVYDIDPSYTVGELELRRQQTIAKLQQDGCMDMNSQLQLAVLPCRLAVVSSATAAGYRDFMNHLKGNEYGIGFKTTLFNAVMQGDEAPGSIIAAMEQIAQRQGEYDAAVIIRGGGAVMDLVCFDDYELALNIAQFPLPVIVGVGHDHDYHVADMVAHTSVKTPTAVADFLVENFLQENQKLTRLYQRSLLTLHRKVSTEIEKVTKKQARIRLAVTEQILKRKLALEVIEKRIENADPAK
ncbi:MAG: exodeoxyribonuclease VII large subunit, partial [Bacteroidales bacterium]|nr:exodeoxyribonuclease VII large subunit [Bacteroidales bacterium]